MKTEYKTMFDKLAPPKSDEELLRAVLSGKAEISVTKRKIKLKPLIIAAAVIITSVVSLLTVNAATQGAVVKFIMGGEEYSGDIYDYVDEDGFRHIGFEVKLPVYEDNYAIIYDVDAPQEENVRVITDETDPEFMSKIRAYADARFNGDAEYEDFGIVLKDSELCEYSLGCLTLENGQNQSGAFGGEFMRIGAAYGKPAGSDSENGTYYEWDFENEVYKDMKTLRKSIYYYVGKE